MFIEQCSIYSSHLSYRRVAVKHVIYCCAPVSHVRRKSPPQTCISSATCQKTASAHSTLQGANLQPFNSHFVLEKVYEKSCTIALASSIRETNSLVTNESCDNAEISDVKQVADIVALCPTPCVQLSRNCKAPHTKISRRAECTLGVYTHTPRK